MLIFYDCGKKNCPDAKGFKCFLGRSVLDRKLQEEFLFGLCGGVVERIKPVHQQCELPYDFFIHYITQFPQPKCDNNDPLSNGDTACSRTMERHA